MLLFKAAVITDSKDERIYWFARVDDARGWANCIASIEGCRHMTIDPVEVPETADNMALWLNQVYQELLA